MRKLLNYIGRTRYRIATSFAVWVQVDAYRRVAELHAGKYVEAFLMGLTVRLRFPRWYFFTERQRHELMDATSAHMREPDLAEQYLNEHNSVQRRLEAKSMLEDFREDRNKQRKEHIV